MLPNGSAVTNVYEAYAEGLKQATAAGTGSAQPEALDERALFESAMREQAKPQQPDIFILKSGRYSCRETQAKWEIWQARADITPSRDAGQEEASTQTVQNAAKPACRMQGGICACHSGGSFGGCAIERGIVQRGFAIKEAP